MGDIDRHSKADLSQGLNGIPLNFPQFPRRLALPVHPFWYIFTAGTLADRTLG